MAVILLVDDEEPLRSNLSRYLTGLGYEVLTAANGRDALDIVEESEIDLLITDINMPEMDGIEVLRALRAKGTMVPVIAMSGGGVFDKRLLLGSAGALGATGRLDKPFELEALRLEVERALG